MTATELIKSYGLYNKNEKAIYSITHIPTGKIYIGSSVNVSRRLKEHIQQLNKKLHGNAHLQNYWNKFGHEEFIIEILEWAKNYTYENLLKMEKFWIDFYQSSFPDFGFNILNDPTDFKLFEKHRSVSTKEKISLKLKAFYTGENSKKAIATSINNLSKITPESKEKSRQSLIKYVEKIKSGEVTPPAKGYKHTKKDKIIMREKKLGIYEGKNNPFYGRNHTEESKQKRINSIKKLKCKYGPRYVVNYENKLYYIINVKSFIKAKFGNYPENSTLSNYLRYWERKGLKILLKTKNNYSASKFKMENVGYFEIN